MGPHARASLNDLHTLVSPFPQVVIELQEPQHGTTILTLKQTGIPYTDRFENGDVLENVERGWRLQILQRIKAVFGYGL